MSVGESSRRLKVAIIGGGPGGLSAAIELSKLPFVDYNLYEKKPTISETGGGISLQPHTWRLLMRNNTAREFATNDYFRTVDEEIEQRRNGRTGDLIHRAYNRDIVPQDQRTCRLLRAKLQAGLLRKVDPDRVHVKKRLSKVEHLPNNRIRISFEDGHTDTVDLLIAADGIRSPVRRFSIPNYDLKYNGQCVYRTIVKQSDVRKIKGIPWSAVFWKHRSGLYVYTCPLGGDDFEVTARIRRAQAGPGEVSWGRPFDFCKLLPQFEDFCPQVKQILRLAADGNTQEFALLSGPRLKDMTYHNNIAFVGDAAHALCGNFGAGAGFALEDVYTLARCLQWQHSRKRPLKEAMYMYDSIRSPHYQRLFGVLKKFARIKSDLAAEALPIDKEIEQRIKRIARASETWMYDYEIDKVVDDAIQSADRRINDTHREI